MQGRSADAAIGVRLLGLCWTAMECSRRFAEICHTRIKHFRQSARPWAEALKRLTLVLGKNSMKNPRTSLPA